MHARPIVPILLLPPLLALAVLGGAHASAASGPGGDRGAGKAAAHRPGAGASAFRPRTFRSRHDLRPFKPRVTKRRRGTAPGYLFLTVRARDKGRQNGPMIVDDRGELVWFQPVKDKFTSNLQVVRYRGRSALAWWEGRFVLGYGYGQFVVADHHYRRIAHIKPGNGYLADFHDVQFTRRGTVIFTIYSAVRRDLTPYGGPANAQVLDNVVQEMDLATGKVLLEWHSLDAVGLDESYKPMPADDSESYDYFHVNALDVDRDGQILISSRNTHALYEIDRRTGALIWRLGGKRSNFKMGPGTEFAWQHDARVGSNGTISMFDNEAAPEVRDRSRGLILKLDTHKMEATLVRQYAHPGKVLASSQGSFQPLSGGDYLVGWGSERYLSEYDRRGRLLLDMEFPTNVNSYRALRYRWYGRPAGRPAIATKRRHGGAIVYASWNGATDVARWQVLAGQRRSKLRPLRSRPRKRFETAIRVRTKRRYLAVRAKSRSGRVLGTSRIVRR